MLWMLIRIGFMVILLQVVFSKGLTEQDGLRKVGALQFSERRRNAGKKH
jgi:hypothetical protein